LTVDFEKARAALRPIEPDYRAVAAQGSQVLPLLRKLLADEDVAMAARAVYAAGAVAERIKTPDGDRALREIARMLTAAAENGDVLLRVAAASAAHALPPRLATGVQVRSLSDDDVGVRKTALEMAPRELTPELVELCDRLSQDEGENEDVRGMAATLLADHPRR